MVSALGGSLLMGGVVALLQRTEARPRIHSVTSLPLGEMPARAAVRGQEWVGERRTQSETHSLIRTHAISRSIFCPLRLSVMLRSGLHWRSIRSIAAIGCSKISSPLYC